MAVAHERLGGLFEALITSRDKVAYTVSTLEGNSNSFLATNITTTAMHIFLTHSPAGAT
jgi:hypothetical protein